MAWGARKQDVPKNGSRTRPSLACAYVAVEEAVNVRIHSRKAITIQVYAVVVVGPGTPVWRIQYRKIETSLRVDVCFDRCPELPP